MPIVYVVTNTINGRKYVGKCRHKKPGYLGSGLAITHAINKYGKDAFTKEIIFECETLEEAADYEKEMTIKWGVVDNPNWYNLKIGGSGGSSKGWTPSEETKRRLSESLKGSIPWNKGLSGDPRCAHKEETKQKIRETNMGHNYNGPEMRRKMSIAMTGKTHSEETRKKISEGHKGQIPWNKGKKISKPPWNKGKTGVYSEETRRKMSESAKNRKK